MGVFNFNPNKKPPLRGVGVFYMAEPKIYVSNEPLTLECGDVLPSVTIAYHTYGTLSPTADNVIWVCHALTANSEVADWWPHTVENGRFLDPDRHFIVCANFLGSCYGTTGPASVNPATGEEWGLSFPQITVRDMVSCHQLLARHLGITSVQLLVGASIGGFQAMEWAVMQPGFARRLALICTTARITPWVAAFNESQRMAIEADTTFTTPSPEAGRQGMAVARSIALLTYRGRSGYVRSQANPDADHTCFNHRVLSHQRYQGEKLRRRFDARSYYRLTQAVDSHNLSRHRGTLPEVLSSITCPTLVVACTTDIMFPPSEHEEMVAHLPHCTYELIHSPFGHDGFLVEADQLNALILDFLNKEQI